MSLELCSACDLVVGRLVSNRTLNVSVNNQQKESDSSHVRKCSGCDKVLHVQKVVQVVNPIVQNEQKDYCESSGPVEGETNTSSKPIERDSLFEAQIKRFKRIFYKLETSIPFHYDSDDESVCSMNNKDADLVDTRDHATDVEDQHEVAHKKLKPSDPSNSHDTSCQQDPLLNLVPRVHVMKLPNFMIDSDEPATELDQIYSSFTQSLFNRNLGHIRRHLIYSPSEEDEPSQYSLMSVDHDDSVNQIEPILVDEPVPCEHQLPNELVGPSLIEPITEREELKESLSGEGVGSPYQVSTDSINELTSNEMEDTLVVKDTNSNNSNNNMEEMEGVESDSIEIHQNRVNAQDNQLESETIINEDHSSMTNEPARSTPFLDSVCYNNLKKRVEQICDSINRNQEENNKYNSNGAPSSPEHEYLASSVNELITGIDQIEECASVEMSEDRPSSPFSCDSRSDSEDKYPENQDMERPSTKNKFQKTLTIKELKPSTRKAMAKEMNRKKRINKQERIYQQITEKIIQDSDKPRLILDIDRETNEVRVEVVTELVKDLKPHQRDGIKFMYNSIIENVDRIEESGSGCILAHDMGSGKSLQVIALIHTLLTNQYTKGSIRRALITVPGCTIRSWEGEFKKWILNKRLKELDFYVIHTGVELSEPTGFFREWRNRGGVLIIGHGVFSENLLKAKAANSMEISEQLRLCPDLIAVDEAHFMKRSKRIYRAVAKVQTKRKIFITGTPLPKDFCDYYWLMDLIKPRLLGCIREFNRRFGDPIENPNGYEDGMQLKIQQANRLQCLVSGSIHRFKQLELHLPPKHEFVISIRPSALITEMHNFYLDNVSQNTPWVLPDYNKLLLCVNHPFILKSKRGDKDSRNESASSNTSKHLDWYSPFLQPHVWCDHKLSGKFFLLFKILVKCVKAGDKLVVVSQSRETMDLIARLLEAKYRWKLNVDYGRIETDFNYTKKKKFNPDSVQSYKLIMMSSRSIGIDLTAANRVIIFDVCWNPVDDAQAISRVYRFGQTKPVYVYRFVTSDTMEEAVFRKRIDILGLINVVVDNKLDYTSSTFWSPEKYREFRPKDNYESLPFKVENDSLLADALASHEGFVLNCVDPNSFLKDDVKETGTESGN